jgi:hypothetical protein
MNPSARGWQRLLFVIARGLLGTTCACSCSSRGSNNSSNVAGQSSSNRQSNVGVEPGQAGDASGGAGEGPTGGAAGVGTVGAAVPAGSTTGLSGATDGAKVPDPSEFPAPIIGQAVRLDKPVQEPQPGYLIIPDDKPADEFMSGLPPTHDYKSFVMAGTSLSDNGLAFFPRFPAVHTLDASETRVTDAGMSHLSRARALTTLSLRKTRITDAGLSHLKNLKTLKSIDLTGTQVTDQGVA